nr:hypothetical protein [Streptomyces avicenniae]
MTPPRKQVLLRLDPAVHDALARWAAAELRSTNAQIDYVLRQALLAAGRLPSDAGPTARRGRPRRPAAPEGGAAGGTPPAAGPGPRDADGTRDAEHGET